MFIENFTKFIRYYGKGRRLKLFGFLLLSLITGFFEFLGIAVIYPFILLIVKPESIIYSKYYIEFVKIFHIHNVIISAFVLGAVITFLFIAKNIFMLGSLYLQNKFINNWKKSISEKFMYYYMFSPFKNTLKTSPSEKIYNLSFLINQSLDGFIFRLMNLITNIIIVIMILGLLFSKFLFAALIASIFVLFSMSLHNKIFKHKTEEIAQKYLKKSTEYNQSVMENINNLKEIKILSAENNFYNDYIKVQNEYFNILFETNFYGSIPPYIIEILVVFALFIVGGIISLQNIENTSWMIASYAVLAASIFRIAPALNRVQTSINVINTSRNFVKTMIAEYEKYKFDYVEKEIDLEIDFNSSILLKDVYFTYKKEPVIKELNLEIKKGEFCGIIGLSGAGKSTLADILMGLLPIDSGEILVDGMQLNNVSFGALRKLIGYVPQQINIIDGTFKRNIAFGLREEDIDDEKVIEALKKAQLYDFVSNFEEGINAKVVLGSSGLSQGQKQRLAIARILYRNPQIIILDEATSSLDVQTENEITQVLNYLKGEKTIIAIAHRLSTLKTCDRLIYLKQGRIIDTGNFEDLCEKHKDFEKLVKLSNINNK